MSPTSCRYILIALIVLQPIWFGWLAPPELTPFWLAVGLMAGPLVVALPFVWRAGQSALVVTGCILLVHFCVAIAELWANPAARVPGIIQVVLITLYFIAMSSLRFGRRADT